MQLGSAVTVVDALKPMATRTYWSQVYQGWKAHDCAHRAAALAFVTALSLVPLTAMTVGILAVLGQSDGENAVVRFISRRIFPLQGTSVTSYVTTFAHNIRTGALGITGVLLSLAVTFALFENVESSFNHIWQTRHPRAWVWKITIFWSLATLGPMAMGLSILQGASLLRQFAVARLIVPFFATWVLLILANRILPNRPVPWMSAVVAGFISAVAFEAAKYGFSLYFAKLAFHNYKTIYGAFAALPVLLLWMDLSWSAVLLGAVAGRVLDSPPAKIGERDDRSLLKLAVAVFSRYGQGKGPIDATDLAVRHRMPLPDVMRQLERLQDRRILSRVQSDLPRYVPARPADQVTTAQVLGLTTAQAVRTNTDSVDGLFDRIDDCRRSIHGTTISELLDSN